MSLLLRWETRIYTDFFKDVAVATGDIGEAQARKLRDSLKELDQTREELIARQEEVKELRKRLVTVNELTGEE